ncbi:MAG TPA: hypothetical protein VFX86_03900 [Candidatus Saccharimonadales bacterium]|nr:hypothetical protein [Candidatus Saccharimonadales bacterium]
MLKLKRKNNYNNTSNIIFSFTAKLAVVAVVFLGVALFHGAGKVSAAGLQCPATSASATVPGNWGMQNGGIEHDFASVAVYAYNADSGKELNVGYRLNSDVNRSYSYGSPPAQYDAPANLWPGARIFKYPLGSGRFDNRWFHTGGTLSSPTGSCPGWDEIGPGTEENKGNGFFLDCQEVDTSGHRRNNQFWIDSITTPGGIDGAYGGEWKIKLSTGGGSLQERAFPMNYSNAFSVVNGQNARINLIWEPNDPPPNCVTNPHMPQCRRQVEADCTNAFIENTSTAGGNRKRTHVVIQDITVNKNGGAGPNYDVYNNIENPDPNPGGTYGNIDQFVPSSGGEDDTDVKTGKKWWYQPENNTIRIDITVEAFWDNTGDGVANPTWNKITDVRHDTVVCFQARCDMSVHGDGPGGLIIAGGNMHFSGVFYNDSPPPDNLTLWWPGVKDQNGVVRGTNYEQVYAGGIPYPFSFTVPAPSSIKEETWTFHPVYFDAERIGPDCHANVKTFKHFSLTPSAEVQLSPTVEDPNNARFIGRVDTSFSDPAYPHGFNVHYDADARQTRYGQPTQSHHTVNFGYDRITVPYDRSINPMPNQAGDEYCTFFFVYETSGWIGPNNEFRYTNSDYPPMTDCSYVYDRPYMHVYGSDVISGVGFRTGDTCSSDGSGQGIKAYRSTEAGKGGSGVQFAALAFEQISGFGSASVRISAPIWPHGLSLANTAGTTGSQGEDEPNDGGNYAGQVICSNDFYSDLKAGAATVSGSTININSLPDGEQSFKNGDLTINGGSFNKKAALFVSGDVVINGNITFPFREYLTIIVKGDIYINRNVTRLDGLYVAQPRDHTDGGNIYTCAEGGAHAVPTSNLYNRCRTQLVINGAFVAKDVKFLRVADSLRDSVRRETPNFNTGTGTNAAEIFNFTPEVYLYYETKFEEGTGGQPYDYITTLPPVL